MITDGDEMKIYSLQVNKECFRRRRPYFSFKMPKELLNIHTQTYMLFMSKLFIYMHSLLFPFAANGSLEEMLSRNYCTGYATMFCFPLQFAFILPSGVY